MDSERREGVHAAEQPMPWEGVEEVEINIFVHTALNIWINGQRVQVNTERGQLFPLGDFGPVAVRDNGMPVPGAKYFATVGEIISALGLTPAK